MNSHELTGMIVESSKWEFCCKIEKFSIDVFILLGHRTSNMKVYLFDEVDQVSLEFSLENPPSVTKSSG